MKYRFVSLFFSSVAAGALSAPAHAQQDKETDVQTAWEASRVHDLNSGKITTGVARARDPLDSATSTSSIDETEVFKLSATSLGDLFRNIPGIRAEAGAGEVGANYTIRGLPLVSNGTKYLQFQEDGMPGLEFGDIFGINFDNFIRADFNVASIESIRGGSASTFASDAPGGVINLISKTGEVEGGSVQASAGVDYHSYRSDFDYGARLSPTLRFHVGGFYRTGNGPRRLGYTADNGGQVKFNATKDFAGGYLRIYAKYLDDRNANILNHPMMVTGTDENPKYHDLPGFSARKDALQSAYINSIPGIDSSNNVTGYNARDGFHNISKSIGFDAKFNIGEWSVFERMRYADQSVDLKFINPLGGLPAQFAAPAFGAPGGSLVYASGPQKGTVIADPASLNGNGLLSYSVLAALKLPNLNNFTNDLRIGRVWKLLGGDLTGTIGLYNARQQVQQDRAIISILQDVVGNGHSALVDIIKPDGTPLSQDGVLSYSGPVFGYQQSYDVAYTVTAPYGSINLRKGRLSLGASVRVDNGKVDGIGRANTFSDLVTIDVNRDGVMSDAEKTFPVTPFSNATPINYSYRFVSYSGSLNYRISDSLSAFARYSRGARAGADRLIFTSAISPTDGSLADKSAGYDPVRQAEVGAKFRGQGYFLNLTGFWAKVSEFNTQLKPNPVTGFNDVVPVKRAYRAFGAEIEGGVQKGAFSLTANATLTNAKILAADDLAIVGNTPRHQAKLIFQIMPQYETGIFTIGGNIIGTTKSYAQDENQLRMPAYTTVNAFLQVRPVEKVVLSLNANNLFDVLAVAGIASGSIAGGGVVMGQTLYGRTIMTSARFYF